jgi:predicted phosphoadenosine phosphosulfate sulfurtransferase
MSKLKVYDKSKNVYQAAKERIAFTFDNFERVYVSFSGGKDSTVMTHLVLEEAIKRKRKVGLLIIDLEAQYENTIKHLTEMIDEYHQYLDVFWVCLPLSLRNAVSNFEPRWTCWDTTAKDLWVRPLPKIANCEVITEENNPFDFFVPGMEFEEFVPLFAEWYASGHLTAACVGIRADESLNRFRTIASKSKVTLNGKTFTTEVTQNVFNVYPIYDWKTEDIWKFHAQNPSYSYNETYNLMYKAGLNLSEMRLCQPYGDDQRRGLYLYHVLEPKTWYKVVQRVNGVTSGALYIQDNGNITGYNKITKPENHTWESFAKLLLATMPSQTRLHYQERFTSFLKGWRGRGYYKGIPDEAPEILESKHWAPSWRRICKVLLRNDWWCKGLGLTQPKSAAYGKYLELRNEGNLGNRDAFEKKMRKESLDSLALLLNSAS